MILPAARLDRLLAEAVGSGAVAGAVALVHRRDAPPYIGASGWRCTNGEQAMTVDTIFRVASMAKAVTSVAAMQLVEQGRLSLDRPIGDIMPALAMPQILAGFDAGGAPLLRPATRAMTLRHLLAHTSGFAEDIWSEAIRRYAAHTGLPSLRTGRRAALLQPLLFEPGERWQYGINHDWIGLVIEAVSGQSLDAYLQQHLLGPLGMHDTGYVLTAEQETRLAGLHRREANGVLRPLAREPPASREYLPGGGSLYSSGPDYATFLRMLLDEGRGPTGPVLRPDTVAEMRRVQPGTANAGLLEPARRDFAHPISFLAGVPRGWGLSFLINTERAPSGRGACSLGWAGLCNTYYWWDPTAGIAAVLLTQILPFADPGALALLDAFERAVYAH